MNCTDMERLVLLQDSGELTQDQQQELAKHLAHCPSCRDWHADLTQLHMSFAAEMNQRPGPSQKTMDSIHRAAMQRHKPIMLVFTRPWPIAIAAAASLTFLLTTLRFSAGHQATAHVDAAQAGVATEIIPIIALITGSESTPSEQDRNEPDITVLANELLRLQNVVIDLPVENAETVTPPEDYQPTTLQWNNNPESRSEIYG